MVLYGPLVTKIGTVTACQLVEVGMDGLKSNGDEAKLTKLGALNNVKSQ